MQDARLGRLFPGELPQWKPNIGSFFELQHRQRQGDPWIFCRDPRFSHANPNQGSRQRLFVVDDSRKHWAIFSAYFFESSTIGMSVIGLAKAAAAIQRIGISDCDIVVVKQAPNDGRAHALVKHLRNGVGFRGTVYGFAENQRLKSKLKKAGCTTVFGPEASGMLELLGAVFPAGHIG
jgi:hypothetical protein